MTEWQIDPAHTGVEFAVKHMMFATVRGRFTEVNGTLTEGEEATVDVTIPTASINTGVGQRDDHLRSADFFDVENHPEMRFTGKLVKGGVETGGTLQGELTIRDITKPVTLEVEATGEGKDPWGNVKRGYLAKGQINRADFGLTWNQALEAGGVLVSDTVKLTLDVQLQQAAPVAA
ncbi:MAG: YceI family protein [Gemmatimonadales bacterium]